MSTKRKKASDSKGRPSGEEVLYLRVPSGTLASLDALGERLSVELRVHVSRGEAARRLILDGLAGAT